MARQTKEPKPNPIQPGEQFVELMLVAADFVKNCGGMEQAKKSLQDAGQFIDRAGGVTNASKALEVLQTVKDRISG
jgi:hypothetical protein